MQVLLTNKQVLTDFQWLDLVENFYIFILHANSTSSLLGLESGRSLPAPIYKTTTSSSKIDSPKKIFLTHTLFPPLQDASPSIIPPLPPPPPHNQPTPTPLPLPHHNNRHHPNPTNPRPLAPRRRLQKLHPPPPNLHPHRLPRLPTPHRKLRRHTLHHLLPNRVPHQYPHAALLWHTIY